MSKVFKVKTIATMLKVSKKDIKLALFNAGEITWSWAVNHDAKFVVELITNADGGGTWTTPLITERGIKYLGTIFPYERWMLISPEEYGDEITAGRWEVGL